jgi:hypothetical protein
MFERKRTPYEIIYYSVFVYFQGLSFEKCGKAIEPFIKRTPKAIWLGLGNRSSVPIRAFPKSSD